MSASTSPRFSLRSHWARDQAIGYLMAQGVENRGVISLAAGLVDEATLPVDLCRDIAQEILSDPQRARIALQYGTTSGSEALREQVLVHLARLENRSPTDLGVGIGQVVLTSGSQQLLALVAETLLDPGDICLVAAPTYFVFLGVLKGVGATAIPIAADGDGLRTDVLEAELIRLEQAGLLSKVKLIYVVSDFENPSGVSLSEPRREELVRLARSWSKSHRIHILEDAAYRELRYAGEPLRSLWSFDTAHDTVILAQTYSKSFSPGVRVGFGVLPESLIAPICNRKSNEDFGSPRLNQDMLEAALASGRYQTHLQQVVAGYRRKRDTFLAALERQFHDLPEVSWVRPDGGLYVWMSLPETIETGFHSELFKSAVRDYKVMYVPGELSYPSPENPQSTRPSHQMRLSFGVQSEAGLVQGAERLAGAVRGILHRRA